MGAKYVRGDTAPIIAPVATATAVEVGDLVGISSGNVVQASDVVWDTNTSTTQAAFVALFLGVSGQKKEANVARVPANSQDNRIRVETQGIYEFDCASANFAVGDLVGPAKATGNALEDQKVVAVATENLAVGRVAEAGTSVTTVKVKIMSVKAPAARQS